MDAILSPGTPATPAAPGLTLASFSLVTPASPGLTLSAFAAASPAVPFILSAAGLSILALPFQLATLFESWTSNIPAPLTDDFTPASATPGVTSATIGDGDSAITYTLADGVTSASVTHTSPQASQHKTLWTMGDSNDLTILPGADARITISNTTPACTLTLGFTLQPDPDVIFYFAGDSGVGDGHNNYWSIRDGATCWEIEHVVDTITLYYATSSDYPANPADATWNPPTTGTGTAALSRLPSSALQVLFEIFPLSDVVTAALALDSDGSGSISAADLVTLSLSTSLTLSPILTSATTITPAAPGLTFAAATTITPTAPSPIS